MSTTGASSPRWSKSHFQSHPNKNPAAAADFPSINRLDEQGHLCAWWLCCTCGRFTRRPPGCRIGFTFSFFLFVVVNKTCKNLPAVTLVERSRKLNRLSRNYDALAEAMKNPLESPQVLGRRDDDKVSRKILLESWFFYIFNVRAVSY